MEPVQRTFPYNHAASFRQKFVLPATKKIIKSFVGAAIGRPSAGWLLFAISKSNRLTGRQRFCIIKFLSRFSLPKLAQRKALQKKRPRSFRALRSASRGAAPTPRKPLKRLDPNFHKGLVRPFSPHPSTCKSVPTLFALSNRGADGVLAVPSCWREPIYRPSVADNSIPHTKKGRRLFQICTNL